MCRLYTPFERKNKNNLIDAGDYIIQQHMPVEILQERSDFTLKGTTRVKSNNIIYYVDQEPNIFIDNELQWTTLDIDDPCYQKETYRTMKHGKHMYVHRYNRKPTSWQYLQPQSFLYVHGLKQLKYPIRFVQDNIVTFNTTPILKAHIAVCRTQPTKLHLCNVPDEIYNTPPWWFNKGYVADTGILVHVLMEDDDWVLCHLKDKYYDELYWLPSNLIQQRQPRTTPPLVQHGYIHGRIPVVEPVMAHLHTVFSERIQDTQKHTRMKEHIMNDIQERRRLYKSTMY